MRPGALLSLTFCYWFASSVPSAHAWGDFVHRVIGRVAAQQLSPSAQQKVHTLLGNQTLADVSNDADKWRESRPETSPWHYVNIPFAATTYLRDRDCPQDNCVIAIIDRYRTTLADRSRERSARKEALIFLVHFVADLHQPLHCIDNNDRGGNDVAVTFFGEPATLHSVWDFGLLAHARLKESTYVKRLQKMIATRNMEKLQRGTITDWALESHALAKAHAYQLPPNGEIGSNYYNANIPIVDNQMAKAAVRLARVMNDALP